MSTINPENFFLDIQQAAADTLLSDAYFYGIPVLTEQLGDLDSAIEIVMSKLGLCVIVQSGLATCSKPDMPGVNFDRIPVRVTIWEDTTLNRFSEGVNVKHYSGAALTALWLLTHQRPRKDGTVIANCFIPDDPTFVDLRNQIDREQFPNIQGIEINLLTSGGFDYEPQDILLDGNNQALLDGMGIYLTTGRPINK